MPLTEITWSDDDDALGGGPANSSGNRTPPAFLVSPGATGTKVTMIPAGTPTNLTLTAGLAVDGFGNTIIGFSSASAIGTLAPATFNGATIGAIVDDYIAPGLTPFGVTVQFTGIVLQNFFTSITANGATFLSSAATYNNSGGNSNWNWLGGPLFGLANGGVYTVAFA